MIQRLLLNDDRASLIANLYIGDKIEGTNLEMMLIHEEYAEIGYSHGLVVIENNRKIVKEYAVECISEILYDWSLISPPKWKTATEWQNEAERVSDALLILDLTPAQRTLFETVRKKAFWRVERLGA